MATKVKRPIRNLPEKLTIVFFLAMITGILMFIYPLVIPAEIRASHFYWKLAGSTVGFDFIFGCFLYIGIILHPRQILRARAECRHRIISYCTICKKEF